MATTSPDNLRTPDPGDPYNLVPDLATLAGDVQDALNFRANVATGTASQRVAFTSTATPGMLWQDTDGIKMIWRKGASAWEPAVWHWSGTTVQMNGFSAPNGFVWQNTTDNTEYVHISGSWVGQFKSCSGSYMQPVAAINTNYSTTVNFPTGLFTQAPSVTASFSVTNSHEVTTSVTSITSSAATIFTRRSAGSVDTLIRWMAVGV